ncbi:MAG: hypothetical protein D6705_05535 [Deltaproteobacteria bacterium]|nr:MAG: hypothetical protein D6705_05535 [Deltaproteobacteria bacterium]
MIGSPVLESTMHLRTLLFALACLAAPSGCCTKPWRAFDMPRPPDLACRVGPSTHGYDLYVWSCVDGSKTVVAAYGAEMSCQEPRMETVPCDAETSWERAYPGEVGPGCRPPPPSMTWPGDASGSTSR